MINKKILTRAEYTSLGISALGTIIAATTGQIAFATSPLICSLFLNVVNRTQLDKRTRNISHKIALVNKKLTKNTEHTLNPKDNSDGIKQDYQQDLIELTQQIETLKRNLTQLESINKSNEIMLALPTIDKQFKALEQKFNNIDDTINHFIGGEELDRKTIAYLQERENKFYDFVQQQINGFNSFIQDNRPQYQLVLDRQGSRDVLLEALKKAQERIILDESG